MVTARYPPHMGGIETHVEEVARRLAARDVEVTVLTTDPTGELPREERTDGFVVRRFPAWPRSRDYYLSPSLLQAVWAGDYDLLHVQGVHTILSPLVLLLAQRRSKPTVLTLHTGGNSNGVRNLLRRPQWALQTPILRRVDRVVGVCRYEIELFARSMGVPPWRFTLIRNGSHRLPVSGERPSITGSPLLLSIGRLERFKGHHRAIDAMPELLVQAPAARLAVVGSGPYESSLRARAAELGLGDAVAFASFGPDERGALGSLVRSADAAVLLSDYEANPVAVMEALALGVSVLVADTSGLSELGPEGLARTIGLDASPAEVAEAMLQTADDTRWAEAPPDLPTWEGCADQLFGVYREVLDARRPAGSYSAGSTLADPTGSSLTAERRPAASSSTAERPEVATFHTVGPK